MDEAERRDRARRARADAGARGLLLGLALGDTWGAAGGRPPSTGPLRAGVATQLACFTAEGLIRASVRGRHRGICHPPSVVWHAYCRWAAVQGVEPEAMRRRWGAGTGEGRWPDGWLARVPALAERRGNAPATVAALAGGRQGTPDEPATGSRGWHALARTLPAAAFGPAAGAAARARLGRELAALTHGDPAAQSAAVHGARLLAGCLEAEGAAGGPGHGVPAALSAGAAPPPPDGDGPAKAAARTEPDRVRSGREGAAREGAADPVSARLAAALGQAAGRPGDPALLARLAPDLTADAALAGGAYAAASFPDPADLPAALRFAAGGPAGEAVACVAGALLGAAHGAEALPADLVSRHELAWVLDTLGRDLVAEALDSPSGGEYEPAWDRTWATRYPGW